MASTFSHPLKAPRAHQLPIRQGGASLLEFAVLTILILIFIVIAAGRIWTLRIAAERVNIEQMVGAIRSALGNELAASVVKHGSAVDLGSYQHANPITLLKSEPENYLGEFDTAPEEPIPGAWYFNRRDGTLNYRVRFAENFTSGNPDDPGLIRFQIRLDYQDNNRNGRYDEAIDSVRALSLVSLTNYYWTVDPDQE